MKKFVLVLLAVMMALTSVASAAGLPKKIEVQLPAAAGGGTDVVGRALTDYINKKGETTMTIKNNTDGSGVVAFETIRTAKKDGSKILFFHTTLINKYATGIYNQSPVDSFKIAGVGLPVEKGGYVLVVPVESGITTLDEFIAKAKEAELRIGIESGGSSHLMSGMMMKEMDINLRLVESGPDTEKLTNLVGGSIDCALVNGNQAKQYIEGGKVNALACFSSSDEGGRCSNLPDVPSFIEQGYHLVFGTYFYILLPLSASDDVALAIHDAFAEACEDPEVDGILSNMGMSLRIAPFDQNEALMRAQQESLVGVCQELGLAK